MRRYAAMALILMLLAAMMLPFAHADAGDFAGDSDWGYDDWDSSDDSGWSSSDNNYYGGSHHYGSSGSVNTTSEEFVFLLIGFLPLLLIVFFIIFIVRHFNNASGNIDSRQTVVDLSKLREYDPDFNLDEFQKMVGVMYVQLQNAWTAKDLESVRPILSDAFFNQLSKQLEVKNHYGLTNYVEQISILGSTITSYERWNNYDILRVRLTTRICDYTIEDKTGKIISGDKSRLKTMVYEWTLIRSKNEKALAQLCEMTCPNCGAPLKNSASSKCPHCGSIVTGLDFDWTLASIRGIMQRTQ